MFELVLFVLYLGFRVLGFLGKVAGYSLLLALAVALSLLGGAAGPEAELEGEPREPTPGQADDGAEGGLPGWEAALAEVGEVEANRNARAIAEALSPAAAPTTF